MKRKYQVITNFEARSVLLIATLTLGAAGHALARGTAMPTTSEQKLSGQFAKTDRDGSNALHAEEAKSLSVSSARFIPLDANRDGALSADAFMSATKGSKPPAR